MTASQWVPFDTGMGHHELPPPPIKGISIFPFLVNND